jgi:hypothetical protein
MQGKLKVFGEPIETVESELAAFLKIHPRRPQPAAPSTRFSARLALQRAFVAAPTD